MRARRFCDYVLALRRNGSEMSDTPQTDALLKGCDSIAGVKDIVPFAMQDFARNLERDRADYKFRLATQQQRHMLNIQILESAASNAEANTITMI